MSGKTVTVNNDGALTVSDDVMNNLTNFEVTTGEEHSDRLKKKKKTRVNWAMCYFMHPVWLMLRRTAKSEVNPGDVVTYHPVKILLLNKKVQPLRFLPRKCNLYQC